MSTNHWPQVTQLEGRKLHNVLPLRSLFNRQRATAEPERLPRHRPTPFPPFYRWARWPGA